MRTESHDLGIPPLQRRRLHVERLYRAKQHPTALERQMHYLIGAYDDSLHVLRAEVDRLRDAVDELTDATKGDAA